MNDALFYPSHDELVIPNEHLAFEDDIEVEIESLEPTPTQPSKNNEFNATRSYLSSLRNEHEIT